MGLSRGGILIRVIGVGVIDSKPLPIVNKVSSSTLLYYPSLVLCEPWFITYSIVISVPDPSINVGYPPVIHQVSR